MIAVKGLHKHYRGRRRSVHVLDDVHLEIPKGAFFTLLGPSGCGKTTMLRTLAGLEQYERGQIWFGEQLVADPQRRIFVPSSRRGIGMVFQSYAIWPNMDVFGNVAYPLRVQRGSPGRDELRRRVAEVLKIVGLQDLLEAPATALSGGQQQRVALARALVSRPSVLLLDEPLSNLDSQLRERMRNEIRDIQRALGITTVYVTHDRAEALSMSTHVAVMNRGRIEMTGSPVDIYERPQTDFTASFLGACNRIPGVLRKVDAAGQAEIDTPHGNMHCRVPDGHRPGDAVTVIVRPEDIELSAAPAAGSRATWVGVVPSATY
jgi:iron(III) transport system ATP-binding protein